MNLQMGRKCSGVIVDAKPSRTYGNAVPPRSFLMEVPQGFWLGAREGAIVDAHKYDGDEPCGRDAAKDPFDPARRAARRGRRRLPIRGCHRAGSPYLSGQGWLAHGREEARRFRAECTRNLDPYADPAAGEVAVW